jgi:hypothetical protein
MKRKIWICIVSIFLTFSAANFAHADEVTDWNQVMLRASLLSGASPLVVSRVAAMVQSAVFDAVNGVEPRYNYIHVKPAAPQGSSARAAAVQAAYVTIVSLFPARQSIFDAQRSVSLQEIASEEDSASIAAGIQWGKDVANAILAWRSTDGFTPPPPPFLGGSSQGMWRATPPAFAAGAGKQFAYIAPWAIQSPSQFRPAGPPALTSARYAKDLDETKTMGHITSASDQTSAAFFWDSASPGYLWNSVAQSLLKDKVASKKTKTLLENARLFARLNIAMADAAIACWEAKYAYVFWRPITAIPLADTDNNPATIEDPAWSPLFATPAHPEYPSGHSALSGAATVVLEDRFGKNTHFHVRSDLLFGAVRSFKNFSDAMEEIQNARIYAGIHFRSATEDGQAVGIAIGNYVLQHAVLPLAAK